MFYILSTATELIKELMVYEVRSALLRGLVALLKPSKQGISKHKIQKGMVCFLSITVYCNWKKWVYQVNFSRHKQNPSIL